MRRIFIASVLLGVSAAVLVLNACVPAGHPGAARPTPTPSVPAALTTPAASLPASSQTPSPTATAAPPSAGTLKRHAGASKPPRETPGGRVPAIVVITPRPGDTVASPLRTTGTADVFEARFRVRVIDRKGVVISDFPIRVTAGSGTRGRFDAEIPYPEGHAGTGVLFFFKPSAKNGSPTNEVEVRVTLM